MKQGVLRGFGASYLAGAKPPQDMPDSVVTGCASEADAIRLSVEFARRRFGYRQIDIAKLCGWASDSHLSQYKRDPESRMPDCRRTRFAQVTGCNLLEQYEQRQRLLAGLTAPMTQRERDAAAVAEMLRVAA